MTALLCVACKKNYLANLSPHKPVDLYLEGKLASVKVSKLSKPQEIRTRGVVGPRWAADGWKPLIGALKGLREGVRQGRFSQEMFHEILNHLSHQFADMMEGELISATGVEPTHRGQRARKAHVTMKPLLKARAVGDLKASDALRWAKRVADDVAKAIGLKAFPSLLYGREKAADAVKSDEELTIIIGKIIKLAGSWQTDDTAQAAEKAQLLQDLTGSATDRLREKEKNAAIRTWKNWLKEDAEKGSGRAHAMSRLPQAWIAREAKSKDGVMTGDPTELLQSNGKNS